MIAIIDYDAGNIRSVEKAFNFIGEQTAVTGDPDVILSADRVVLPGVGAFGDAMGRLERSGLADAIREVAKKGTPFLGICLGLQLLFEESEESPGVCGLGILKGKIIKIPENAGLKVPHIGWNSVSLNGGRLFRDTREGEYFYFVHSFYLKADDERIVKAKTSYGADIHASVESGNVFATQFHPEKSGEAGLKVLKNFASV